MLQRWASVILVGAADKPSCERLIEDMLGKSLEVFESRRRRT